MMKSCGLTIAGALAAGFLSGQAFAEPEVCKVVANSREAGRLEVSKTILPANVWSAANTASQIDSAWSPATSASSVNLILSYTAADQDHGIGKVDGVEIDFPQPKGTTQDQFTAQLIADGMVPLPLNHAAKIVATDRLGFVLDGALPADRAVGRLLGQGAHAKVIIFKADRVLQPEMFEGTQMSLLVLGGPNAIFTEEINTTAIAARDILFAQAAPSVVARDPKFCTPLRYESGVLVEKTPDK